MCENDPALIVRSMDGAEVKRIAVKPANRTPRQLEKIVRGLLRNMDTDRFYVDDSAFDAKVSP